MKLLPADVIITTDKRNLLSKAILATMKFFQRDPVNYQHAMLVIDDDMCVEAVSRIELSVVRDRFKDFKKYKIIRHNNLTPEERQGIADRAKSLVGLKYSVLRIALQLFDQVFNTNYFTRRIKDPDQQICSSLVAWCYDMKTGIRFNGVNWAAVDPDDIDDESLKHNSDFETILEWEMD